MRIAQPEGTRGSLKWMQRAVAWRPDLLQPAALPTLDWVSPLPLDDFAEYRDAAFLSRLGLARLSPALAEFWPRRGPQWDGLARFEGGVVLAEAKAHLAEFDSPASAAGPASAERIAEAFARVQADMGVAPAQWDRVYYQYANRLAHLWFLRTHGVEAHLLLIGFLGDEERRGPKDAGDWETAYRQADLALGLPRDHALSPFIHHLCPTVDALTTPASGKTTG